MLAQCTYGGQVTTTEFGLCPPSCLRQGLFLLAAAHTRLACSELLGSLLSLVFNLAVGTLGYKSVHHAQLSVGFRDLKSHILTLCGLCFTYRATTPASYLAFLCFMCVLIFVTSAYPIDKTLCTYGLLKLCSVIYYQMIFLVFTLKDE